jgi:hypothetical protein
MAENVYPTLDRAGWLKGPYEKVQMALADYIGTNYSQSNTFQGQLCSLIYAIQQNPNNIEETCNRIQNDFLIMVENYVDDAQVEVTFTPVRDTYTGAEIENRYEILLGAWFATSSGRGSLHQTVMIEGTQLLRIAEVVKR